MMNSVKDAIIDLLVETGFDRGTGKNANISIFNRYFCFVVIYEFSLSKLTWDSASAGYSII